MLLSIENPARSFVKIKKKQIGCSKVKCLVCTCSCTEKMWHVQPTGKSFMHPWNPCVHNVPLEMIQPMPMSVTWRAHDCVNVCGRKRAVTVAVTAVWLSNNTQPHRVYVPCPAITRNTAASVSQIWAINWRLCITFSDAANNRTQLYSWDSWLAAI